MLCTKIGAIIANGKSLITPGCSALKRNHVPTFRHRRRISHSQSMRSDQSSTTILQSFEEGVLTLTLNRPKQRNAMNLELLNELHSILSKLKESRSTQTSVRAVVVQANGSAFCSGHDLKEIEFYSSQPESEKRVRNQELFHLCSKVMQLWKEIPQPTIAAVHGIATAAGCQLVASTDLVIASEKAKFATPGVQIGLFCSTPAVPLLRCIPQKIALDMLYTGRVLMAHEAQMYGLVSRLVTVDKENKGSARQNEFHSHEGEITQKEAHTIAKNIASKSSMAMSIGKLSIYKQISCSSLNEAYDVANEAMVENLSCEDATVGITSFLNKKVPEWKHK